MVRVHILPERVANQIAAGEVIERPAAVVKELVENALDAGATRVAVEFAHGGRSLIRVEDDGFGMGPQDARTALQRHGTSKISEASDLDRLGSFGFRGEALPSIASVSRFTLRTRERGSDLGTEIVVHAGTVLRDQACGRPEGTCIEVEDLFEPVPARRKFMRSDRTEAGHITACVRLYALACPGTAFSLIEDGREVFRSPRCPSLAERVAEIYGREAAADLIALEAKEAGLGLAGLISRPGCFRPSRHDMVAFVNGRPVDSRSVTGAVLEAYREHRPEGHYPATFLFLTCDPAAVDVNVHPAKREVRFRNESAVRGFIIRSILGRLLEDSEAARKASRTDGWGAGQTPGPGAGVGVPGGPAGAGAGAPGNSRGLEVSEGRPAEYVVTAPQSGPEPGRARQDGPIAGRGLPQPAGAAAADRVDGSGSSPGGTAWRLLGVAHRNLALFESPAGLVLLDRKAAHERIWFERIREQFSASAVPVQALLFPHALELDPVASALLMDSAVFLKAAGLEVAAFGRHFFRIEAVPAWMEPADAEDFLRLVLAALRDGRLSPGQPEAARDAFARLAADKAVRLPGSAGESELRLVLEELFATRIPVASPSGRPTFVELGHAELARRFLAG